ncbi:ZNF497 isoform 3, partial [Pan troglodytes]
METGPSCSSQTGVSTFLTLGAPPREARRGEWCHCRASAGHRREMESPRGWTLQVAPEEGQVLCNVKTATRGLSEGAVSGGWGAWENSTEVPREAGDGQRQQATLGAAD